MARKKEKIHILTDSDLKKMEKKCIHEVSKMSIFFFLGWLKETGYIDDDPDILKAEYNRLEDWFGAWEHGYITAEDIKAIILRDTGMEVRILEGDEDDTGTSVDQGG